ncbi:protein kinase, putative [Entamoeba nuttalli P19]|uniref:Protein kinase, putative n=1 Tax=Entamoeba nuttalli (strain P19) TaxID=1076696 RepID=K2H0K6_ENTNP|nr:protein kinase, putative [Entamoeba nuttalli P19]EKE41008.1 protein kinase, putative [Entamoeba nuttalli P19]|eukprot:XP_008856657.1 protein kinase, putative [Entamoeba nuttalli P19]
MSSLFVSVTITPCAPMARVEGVIKKMTVGYSNTMQHCHKTNNQILTQPSVPMSNYGLDNETGDLIIRTDDIIGSATSMEGIQFSMDQKSLTRYRVIQLLGQGTFGQVVKCIDLSTNKYVAIKILKNKPAYFKQSLIEVTVLHFLNDYYDKSPHSRILKMLDYFMYYGHICIVTEMLGLDLYELMRRNRNHGFSIQTIRKFVQQILRALLVLSKGNIVHCDIKPENVLLVGQTSKVKLIDFGSACFENYTLYSYIQSRHYRAPEIVLGLPYSCAIDMWSVGCMTAEFFLGYPLFGATSEYNLLFKMIEMLGTPPIEMLERGTKTHKFFYNEEGTYLFKEQFEYEYENNCKIPPNKSYFKYKTLKELISLNQMRVSNAEPVSTDNVRDSLYDFLKRCLEYDPKERLTPDQALNHPFITDRPLEEYILPPRLYPYVEYGKTVTLEQDEFINIMLKEIPELRYIRGCYNTQQYFKIYKTALDHGHVVNILADSPLRGTITPPSLSSVFIPLPDPSLDYVHRQQTLPRYFLATSVKVDQPTSRFQTPVKTESKEETGTGLLKSNPRRIVPILHDDKKKGVSLPTSLESSPGKTINSGSKLHKLMKMEEKIEKEREKQLEKERKKEEKQRKKEEKKASKVHSHSSSKEQSIDRTEEKPKNLITSTKITRNSSNINLTGSFKDIYSVGNVHDGTINEVTLAVPKRSDSMGSIKKKKWGFSFFRREKKDKKDSPSQQDSFNSHDSEM